MKTRFTRGKGHTGTILGNHTVNDGGLDAIDDVVACSGYIMAIAADFYFVLYEKLQRLAMAKQSKQREPYISSIFTFQAVLILFPVAGQDSNPPSATRHGICVRRSKGVSIFLSLVHC